MNEYEKRQYTLMNDFLEAFEQKTIGIKTLIDSLRGLINTLDDADDAWKTDFSKSWWILEKTYSIASYRKESKIPDASLDEISQAVNRMKQLLSARLGN